MRRRCGLTAGTGHADPLDSLIERLDRLEQENRQLRKEVDALKAARQERVPRTAAPTSESTAAQFVHVDSDYGYEILDPTTHINRKQRLILERRKDGALAPDRLHVQGAITAIANYQSSNRDDKFGYLMRHPTAANQVGDTVSEATIHSAQLGFTGTLGDWLTGHAVALFDPEQSFGSGTNTDLERNQVQMRRAWVLLGNLDRSPFHASLGKMAVPFGADRHGQPVHRLDGLARVRGTRQRRDLGLRERGAEPVRHGDPGRGAVPGREHAGGGDRRSEPVEQLCRGRALRFRAGLRRHAAPRRVLAAGHGVLPGLPGRSLRALSGTTTRPSMSTESSSGGTSRSRASSPAPRTSGPGPSTRRFRSSQPAR